MNMVLSQHSTGLSFGILVDGFPDALHTEAVWGGQGAFGPVAIGTLDKKKEIECLEAYVQLPKRSVQVLECICMFFLAEVILKFMSKLMISSLVLDFVGSLPSICSF